MTSAATMVVVLSGQLLFKPQPKQNVSAAQDKELFPES
jgi:hypothetical protein